MAEEHNGSQREKTPESSGAKGDGEGKGTATKEKLDYYEKKTRLRASSSTDESRPRGMCWSTGLQCYALCIVVKKSGTTPRI